MTMKLGRGERFVLTQNGTVILIVPKPPLEFEMMLVQRRQEAVVAAFRTGAIRPYPITLRRSL